MNKHICEKLRTPALLQVLSYGAGSRNYK